MRPFSLLSDIDCEKIYVIGNHDDSLREFDRKIDSEKLGNGTVFDIYNRHYPEKDEEGKAKGIKIGNRSYFFLHGHQFDKEQAILKKVSKLIGESWNPLDWFQVLFNIPFTKKHWKGNFVIFLGLLFVGEYFLLNIFRQSSFWDTPLWAMFKGFFILVIWATITGFFALSSIPGIVAHTQERIYNLRKPIDKNAKRVIKDRYFLESKGKNIEADVVVFGHTHFASSCEDMVEKSKKLFINSGCWVGKDENINGEIKHTNTFIYIDEGGAYILKWISPNEINCVEACT